MPTVLPPNPSLVAIVLLVNTRAGPRTVFHYPAHPRDDLPPQYSTGKDAYAVDSDSEKSSDTEDTTSDDELGASGGLTSGRVNGSKFASSSARGKNRRAHDPEDDSEDGSDGSDKHPKGPAWETLFGFSTGDLESILAPSRHFNKKKFELMIEPLVYLGYPVYVREDGNWRKRRDKGRRAGSSNGKEDGAKEGSGTPKTSGVEAKEDPSKLAALEGSLSRLEVHDDGESLPSPKDSKASSPNEDDLKAMSMFNVIFVMNPPQTEYLLRINEMYEHVAKKFSKALKYEQARSNWVWTESETILNMKEKARENGTPMASLWHSILSTSGLALALSEVFLSISASKIAHVFINDRFDVSLQIPGPTSISRLPSLIEPQMSGVWLTTATIYDDDETAEDNTLATHFSLLLLQDVDVILKDIDKEHGPSGPVTNPLVDFVKIVKPTMSFHEISTTHSIPLPTIHLLSRHLIFWRRARAIPPVHQRDIYILSPLAPLSTLPIASQAYATRFPALPPLPKMLSLLSGQPRPFRTLIPSKDHRPTYLDILAWLLIGGWVTQLRTFGWVRVPGWVKESVAAETSSAPTSPYVSPAPERGRDDDEIILAPHKASGLTSQYLNHIQQVVLCDVPEVQEAWPRFLKYFTGRQALEKIAAREAMKAKDVWRILGVMEARGVLVVTRYW